MGEEREEREKEKERKEEKDTLHLYLFREHSVKNIAPPGMAACFRQVV